MRTFLRTSHDHRRRSSSVIHVPPAGDGLMGPFLSVSPDVTARRASAGSLSNNSTPTHTPRSSFSEKDNLLNLSLNVPRRPSYKEEDKLSKRSQLRRMDTKNFEVKTISLLVTVAIICMVILGVVAISYFVRNTFFDSLPPHLQ